MALRYYQREAIDAALDYWSNDGGNPLIDMATGTGKSMTMATQAVELIADYKDLRIMNCAHVQELVEGNYKELLGLAPFAPAGVYAAALGQRNTRAQLLYGQLQTVWNKAKEIGGVDLLQIDEVHTVPDDGNTMYRSFINDLLAINPDMKIVGYTATPYRLKSGRLDEGDDRLFDKVVYEYGIRQGIDDGFLCPITSKPTGTKYDLSGVGRAMGEYKLGEYTKAVDTDVLNRRIIEEVLDVEGRRRKALFFCRGIEHATHMRDAVRAAGRTCEVVSGKTPKTERRNLIAALKSGEIWALANDNVLSTGTNIVGVDLIVDLYKTLSASRYVQRVGRGTRVIYPPGFDPDAAEAEARRAAIAASIKPNCRYMDFAGNIDEHGPVDMISPRTPGKGTGEAPIKLCPTCEEILHASVRVCSCCGHEFEFDTTPKYSAKPSEAVIISTQEDWRTVTGRTFREHINKDPNKPPSVRCDYRLGMAVQKEWLCPQHTGFAKSKADRYWAKHGGARPFPASVVEWLERADELAPTLEVRLKPAGKYQDVVDWLPGSANDNYQPVPSPQKRSLGALLAATRPTPEPAWSGDLDDEIPF